MLYIIMQLLRWAMNCRKVEPLHVDATVSHFTHKEKLCRMTLHEKFFRVSGQSQYIGKNKIKPVYGNTQGLRGEEFGFRVIFWRLRFGLNMLKMLRKV